MDHIPCLSVPLVSRDITLLAKCSWSCVLPDWLRREGLLPDLFSLCSLVCRALIAGRLKCSKCSLFKVLVDDMLPQSLASGFVDALNCHYKINKKGSFWVSFFISS